MFLKIKNIIKYSLNKQIKQKHNEIYKSLRLTSLIYIIKNTVHNNKRDKLGEKR